MPWTIAALLLSLSTVAGAEGSHENGAVVRYMHILSEVQTRFATTDIVSEIENTGKEAVEVVYLAELPENAFIRSFYLQRNGNVTFGEIKAKEQAQIEFDDAKKGGRTAAHIRQTNDKTFELRISLKESEKIGFNMTYQEVLHKQSYMYKHVINIKPNLPVLDLEVNVLIADKHNFSKIHVPTFEDGIGSLPVAELLKKPQDERVIMQTADDDSGSIAYLSFEPRVKMHDGQLVVLFNNTENPGTTELQIVDGYFLHQYSPPEDLPVGNKTVVFILDKSGSMLGNKLDQMKEAMNEILDEIADGDRVNLIAFDKDIEKWRDDVTTLDAESKDEAKKWIAGLEARGGTNIDEALHEGLKMLAASEQAHPSFMPSVMVLSDGRPTVGLKEHEEILANLNTAGWNYSVNSISFGNDADYLLMKKIGGRNHPGGIARRIFENADATIQIAGFYNEIALPLLKHIHITYLDEDVEVSSVITSGEQDFFFAGDDFFQLGRFSDPSAVASAVHADLETEDSNGIQESKTEVVPSTACIDPSLVDAANENKAEWAKSKSIAVCGKKDASIGNFIERMWAHLTVVKLEKTLVANTKTDEEKRNVAVRIGNLSVRYGFVSTQTSMVVVLEDNSQALTLEEREFETKILEESIPVMAGGFADNKTGIIIFLACIATAGLGILVRQKGCRLTLKLSERLGRRGALPNRPPTPSREFLQARERVRRETIRKKVLESRSNTLEECEPAIKMEELNASTSA